MFKPGVIKMKIHDLVQEYSAVRGEEGGRHGSQSAFFAEVLNIILDDQQLSDIDVPSTPEYKEMVHNVVFALRSSEFGGYDRAHSRENLRKTVNWPVSVQDFINGLNDLKSVEYVLEDPLGKNYVDKVIRNADNTGWIMDGRNTTHEKRFLIIYDDGEVSSYHLQKSSVDSAWRSLSVVARQMYMERTQVFAHFHVGEPTVSLEPSIRLG